MSYTYDGNQTPVLDRISLQIAGGEFVAFIGQNGAGKTTLAKTFNGLLRPSDGEVLINGQESVRADVDSLARRVGYVYQNPDHQIFARTVEEEVAFGPRNIGLSEAEVRRAVRHALALVDMEAVAGAYPFLLGRGQRQKLAVASVIAMGSPVIVVDEPTTGLDLRGALGIMGLLRQWNTEGRTIIVITHDMNIVAEFAHRTVVMARGRILSDGPTRQVLTNQPMLARASIQAPQITRIAQALPPDLGFPRDVLTVAEFRAALAARLNTSREG